MPRDAHRPHAGAARAPSGAARVLRRADDARAPRRARTAARPAARRTATIVRQMGRDGWLGIGWPKEYGGQGRSAARAVHLLRRGEPRRRADAARHPQHRRARRSGSTAPRSRSSEFLPTILAGEIHFAIGYTEPGAGTDLASLRTRAVRDGDEYVINGQKVFTTGGHDADCRLARVPHRSRRAEAQGHLDHPRAHRRRRASSTRRSGRSAAATRTPPTTRTSASRSRTSCGEENAGWKLITQPAQPRARRARPGGPDRPPAPGGAARGRRRRTRRRRTARRSTTSGCRRRWRGCTRPPRR